MIDSSGSRSLTLLVFCPTRGASIDAERCRGCARVQSVDLEGERPSITCEPERPEREGQERVGTLTNAAVVCVGRETLLTAVNDDPSRVIPILDESNAYVGAIVRGRPSTPPPLREPFKTKAPLTARDLLEHLPSVHERDDMVTAAAMMTSSRARCVPVVNDAREVVGLLDDLALLAAVARARSKSETLKRCSCGRLYTREQWRGLDLAGVMPGPKGQPMELRNCEDCGSTMAMPRSGRDVA